MRKPSILVANGKIDLAKWRKNRFTLDELPKSAQSVRGGHLYHPIAVWRLTANQRDPYPSERPIWPRAARIEVPNATYPVIVLNNRRAYEEKLPLTGRDENWLHAELNAEMYKNFRCLLYDGRHVEISTLRKGDCTLKKELVAAAILVLIAVCGIINTFCGKKRPRHAYLRN